MQYYSWDGDTTGRIIVDSVMKAADRGVRVRLLVDDPFYKSSDSVKAALDAHPNVEIRLFNPLTNRRWSALDFIVDFRRVNRRMHNKLMVADNAAAIVGGRNIGDIYYGVNTIANYRDLDVLAVGPVVRDLSGVFDRYWNSASAVPIAAIVSRAYGAADLDAILIGLREAIAAADTLIRSTRTWSSWQPRAPTFATISCGHTAVSSQTTQKPSPAARRATTWSSSSAGGSLELKEELLVEIRLFRATRRGPGNRQGTARAQRPRARADELASFKRYAAGTFRLCQDAQAADRERHGAIRAAPGYRRLPGRVGRCFPGGRRRRCIPRPWPSTAKPCSSAASTSTRALR